MSEEQQAAVTADSPEVQTESAATEPVQNEAAQESTEQKQERDQDELPKGVRKSIDRLTRQRYQAEAKAEMLERRLAELEAKQTPQPAVQAQPQAPTLEQFGGDWEKFIEAKAEYVAEKKLSDRDRIQSQRSAQQQAQEVFIQEANSFRENVNKAMEAYPDFLQVMDDWGEKIEPEMQSILFALGDKAPDVVYHFAKHPEEFDRIKRMPFGKAAISIGTLSAKVQRPAKKQSNAPAPVSGVAPKANVVKDPAKMNDAEWYKQSRKKG